jgi:hypothetical protein
MAAKRRGGEEVVVQASVGREEREDSESAPSMSVNRRRLRG